MMPQNEIKSQKILVKDIFSNMWFRIPEYQRPYIWTKDEVTELLNDLTFASKDKPNQEYFLGSFVYQPKKTIAEGGEEFDENDLLDGQQRMTTLLLLFACLRDLSLKESAKKACQKTYISGWGRIREQSTAAMSTSGRLRLSIRWRWRTPLVRKKRLCRRPVRTLFSTPVTGWLR